jgi:hypothetical protein
MVIYAPTALPSMRSTAGRSKLRLSKLPKPPPQRRQQLPLAARSHGEGPAAASGHARHVGVRTAVCDDSGCVQRPHGCSPGGSNGLPGGTVAADKGDISNSGMARAFADALSGLLWPAQRGAAGEWTCTSDMSPSRGIADAGLVPGTLYDTRVLVAQQAAKVGWRRSCLRGIFEAWRRLRGSRRTANAASRSTSTDQKCKIPQTKKYSAQK